MGVALDGGAVVWDRERVRCPALMTDGCGERGEARGGREVLTRRRTSVGGGGRLVDG